MHALHIDWSRDLHNNRARRRMRDHFNCPRTTTHRERVEESTRGQAELKQLHPAYLHDLRTDSIDSIRIKNSTARGSDEDCGNDGIFHGRDFCVSVSRSVRPALGLLFTSVPLHADTDRRVFDPASSRGPSVCDLSNLLPTTQDADASRRYRKE